MKSYLGVWVLGVAFSLSIPGDAWAAPAATKGAARKSAPVVTPAPKPAPATPKAAEPVMETETVGEPEDGLVIDDKGASKKGEAAKSAPSDQGNAAFAYTHSLPSPVNMPGGSYTIGTTTAIGVFDFLQLSTNTFRLVNRSWNFQAKVPIIDYPTFIVSAFVGYESINLNHHDNRNPETRINAWQPGLVTGYEINEDMAFFLGGNFHSSAQNLPATYYKSGFFRGARVNFDWSWLYNPVDSKLSSNALAMGAEYDLTYKMIGFGVTHHWPSFQLGIHYIAGVDNHRVLPIFNIASGFKF